MPLARIGFNLGRIGMNLTMSNFRQGRVWTTAVGGAMAVAMVFGASQAMGRYSHKHRELHRVSRRGQCVHND